MSDIKEINEDQFKESIKKGTVLVKIGAEWCTPCKTQHGILEKVASKNDKVNIFELDADKSFHLCRELSIRSVPILILYKDGKEEKRFTGLTDEKTITDFIK